MWGSLYPGLPSTDANSCSYRILRKWNFLQPQKQSVIAPTRAEGGKTKIALPDPNPNQEPQACSISIQI